MKNFVLFWKIFFQISHWSCADTRLEEGLVFGRSWSPLTLRTRLLIFLFGKFNHNNIMLHVRDMKINERISLSKEGTFNFSRYTEKILLQLVVKLLRLPFPSFSGYITTGATEANIYALWLAREWALSKIHSSEKATWLIPKNTHYSISKALAILGILNSNSHIIKHVELDALGRARAEELQKIISDVRVEGENPIILVLTAMTTEYGLIDPITETDAFLIKNSFGNVFFHIDAAFSGFLLPYVEGYENFFKLPSISSIALDFHKNLGGPVGSGAVITCGGLEQYAEVKASYLSEGADFTLTGSRKGSDALAVWGILNMQTCEDRKKQYSEVFRKTKYLAEKLSKFESIKLLYQPKFNYIVFTLEHEKRKGRPAEILKKFSITSSKVSLAGVEHDLFKIIIRNDHTLRSINRLIKALTLFYEGGN